VNEAPGECSGSDRIQQPLCCCWTKGILIDCLEKKQLDEGIGYAFVSVIDVPRGLPQ
jgi:hypothetical protein